jgi:hypothetical protein
MASLNHGHTYFDEFHSTIASPLRQLLLGLHLRIGEIGRLLIPGMWRCYTQANQWLDPNLLLYLPLALLVVTGWWKLARRHHDPLLWSMPFYVGLYVLWPFEQGTRFFTPILPILVAALWPWIERLRRYRRGLIVGFCVAHLLVACGYWLVEDLTDGREYRSSWSALVILAQPLAAQREPAAAAGISDDARLWFQFLLDRPVASVRPWQLIPTDTTLLIQPLSTALPPGFRSIATGGDFRVAQRVRGDD